LVGVAVNTTLDPVQMVVFNELFEYVVLLLPTFVPFNFHWYKGELPPLVGTAVNSVVIPEQTVFPEPDDMLTDGTTLPLIVMVTGVEVAVVVVAQIALEINLQVT